MVRDPRPRRPPQLVPRQPVPACGPTSTTSTELRGQRRHRQPGYGSCTRSATRPPSPATSWRTRVPVTALVLRRGEIVVSASPDVEVYGNRVRGAVGIGILQKRRVDSPGSSYPMSPAIATSTTTRWSPPPVVGGRRMATDGPGLDDPARVAAATSGSAATVTSFLICLGARSTGRWPQDGQGGGGLRSEHHRVFQVTGEPSGATPVSRRRRRGWPIGGGVVSVPWPGTIGSGTASRAGTARCPWRSMAADRCRERRDGRRLDLIAHRHGDPGGELEFSLGVAVTSCDSPARVPGAASTGSSSPPTGGASRPTTATTAPSTSSTYDDGTPRQAPVV